MIDREAVVDALRNCINKPRCQNCNWKECNEFHETFELPKGLVMDIYDLLKKQEVEIRQLKLALDIAKGTCKGISVEGR